jgi:hypothetical protein
MDDAELRLDGNGAAGIFSEVFAADVTTMRDSCAACGAVSPVGDHHLYMYPLSPGAVLRCSRCEAVLSVATRVNGRLRIGFSGCAWIEVGDG